MEYEMLFVLFCFAILEATYRHGSDCFEWTVPESIFTSLQT